MPPWNVQLDPPSPYPQARLALEIDPRRRTVRLGERVPGTGDLEVQAGVIARSFYEGTPGDPGAAVAWLQTPEATTLLDTLEAGFGCDTLWSGDLVAHWSDEAWEAGHALYLGVAARLGVDPGVAQSGDGA